MIISRGWGLLGLLLPIAVVLLGIYFFSPDGNDVPDDIPRLIQKTKEGNT